MQRVQAIRSHVASIENKLNPKPVDAEKQTFAEILKSSQKGEGQFRTDGKNFLSLTTALNSLRKNTVSAANKIENGLANIVNPTKQQIFDCLTRRKRRTTT